MIPVIEHAEDVIAGIAGTFEAAAAVIVGVLDLIGAGVVSVATGIASVGRLLADMATGNYARLAADTEAVKNSFTNQWKSAFKDLAESWQEVSSRFKAPPPTPEQPEGEGGDLEGLGKPGKKTTAVQRDEEELNEIRIAAAKKGYEVGIDQEIRFWESKLAVAKKGSDEYREIMAKLAPLEDAKAKKKVQIIPTESSGIEEAVQEFVQANEEEVRSAEEAARRAVAAYRSARDEEIRIAGERYQDLEKDSQHEVQLGKITAQQRLALLKTAADEEYRVKIQAIHALELVDMQDAQRYQADLNKEVEATREHTRQIVQINQQAALQSMQAWQKLFDGMTNQMNQVLLSMFNGHQKLAQELARVWDGIAENFAKNVLKMAEQYLIGLALQKTGQKSQIMADAKTAAANTYSAVSAVPVVGPVLAPVAAAGAFAAVLAFDSFADGGVVRGPGSAAVPILAHAGERVLSQEQTANFERMVSRSQTSASSGDMHLHYEPKINAFDRNGMRSTLKAHAGDILDIVRAGYRDGKLA